MILVITAFLLLFFLTELAASAAVSFLVGALMSLISGALTLVLTSRASPRVAYCSKFGLGPSFRTAYQTCSAIGFGVASFNLLGKSFSDVGLTVVIEIFKQEFDLNNSSVAPDYYMNLFEAVAAYGLGASMIALITRIGGGIFEAATEAGSELIGKTEGALPFTHSRNAATVALHAGHQIEGVGAGCDLLGSYSELTCVAFLLASSTLVGVQEDSSPCAINLAVLLFPLTILSLGLIVSLMVSVVGVVVTWV